MEYEQTDEFKAYRRKRYAIESKNSQLKNTYGLARNKTSDLKGMTLQSVMAIIAVNLKRIISLQKEKNRLIAKEKRRLNRLSRTNRLSS
ncbi:transposase [uncultured Exiguobacterium sp.]|uniref:transposase n=1 Tax=uncultured Exiguobacterium sp. TaxID=202669 RepID=UPI00345AA7C4